MSRFRLTPAASDDIREIVRYLAEEAGEAIALRVEDELFEHFATLARYPGVGHSRSDLTTRPVVFFASTPYLPVGGVGEGGSPPPDCGATSSRGTADGAAGSDTGPKPGPDPEFGTGDGG